MNAATRKRVRQLERVRDAYAQAASHQALAVTMLARIINDVDSTPAQVSEARSCAAGIKLSRLRLARNARTADVAVQELRNGAHDDHQAARYLGAVPATVRCPTCASRTERTGPEQGAYVYRCTACATTITEPVAV
jgi:hypothetical protein